ncbi:SurA N-terminal domain-containing protein [Nitratireductor aquimarinus]|uniref:peptidylprolyl isomerase n=1 Tax=Nitratireductor TaxID=245876 RepID=UPI0019D33165|nr:MULTISPECIES: SurA N-terminal domain-containing protein [Nitratireductor]MBN7778696.1 SurA N-terminal domain-containing protein [Nitratireductor pacificus]MBN7783019.1 SurA N-terminal domain-containing protein [Nitratireductor pacificus]MBN7791825.1 SurA N-terminal domain-containing protein [Nitratireductor aquimarinus]MBY6101083.1 SurA N-terminal domain-containing protein [Nitratireductor aquimarinus]MCA1260139.1 SurA N-terminal domain-containing protein [Nitratireductor aquimarinus]
MFSNCRRIVRASVLTLAVATAMPILGGTSAMATEIRYVVNNLPVTSYDIDRRVAFLRLQREGGNLRQKATDQMIEQTLKLQEMQRRNINIPKEMVDQAYQRFASGNRMTTSQLNQVMAQSGVTAAHFKDFIRSQIGWSRVMQARNSSTGGMSEQDVVAKMLQQGGNKPSATEYMLQQVIFVVPSAERSKLLGKRQREAQALRGRFRGCDSTREFAKGLIDVTVRDLGRILEPELPGDWKDQIKKTSPGNATGVRTTERGVEFIGVCSTREVSDDRVAQMMFQSEGSGGEDMEKASQEYLAELRKNARITKR